MPESRGAPFPGDAGRDGETGLGSIIVRPTDRPTEKLASIISATESTGDFRRPRLRRAIEKKNRGRLTRRKKKLFTRACIFFAPAGHLAPFGARVAHSTPRGREIDFAVSRPRGGMATVRDSRASSKVVVESRQRKSPHLYRSYVSRSPSRSCSRGHALSSAR